MEQAIIWDCEFLTSEGAPSRFWCGPRDPDQILVQLGAVRLDLNGNYDIGARFSQIVVPRDRLGEVCALDSYFTRLTGITQEKVAQEGLELAEALSAFDGFSGGAPFWAWGRDEYQALAISCYLAGIPAPIPATRFGNAPVLLLKAGIAHDEIVTLRSPNLAAHFGVEREGGAAHNAVDDAHSVALALQHLLRKGCLHADDFIPY
ncbi:3'-5' exonuclease family protein [Profundibacter amoris]|uniref:Exonuclease n=1 Tax=Profundibacter amoris TaxID=2171755 RepID=A0A347UDA5_9RHOB|nr:exonuclease [Profundibacter amoris]AXX96833.1 exonuclease [Profundibacter amoris]